MKPWLHTKRNMYDRMAHFSFGLLMSYPSQGVFMREAYHAGGEAAEQTQAASTIPTAPVRDTQKLNMSQSRLTGHSPPGSTPVFALLGRRSAPPPSQ
jgi:hypothetical protein